MHNLRKKVWIDRFQTDLIWRIALYFVFYQLAVWSFVFIHRATSHALGDILGERPVGFLFLFGAVGVCFVGFLFILDAVRFAHRIVGPIFRFRKMVQALAAGEEMEYMRLREGDHLQELKDEFNEMLKALEQRGAVTLKESRAAKEREPAVHA